MITIENNLKLNCSFKKTLITFKTAQFFKRKQWMLPSSPCPKLAISSYLKLLYQDPYPIPFKPLNGKIQFKANMMNM